jgi:hypothetical protein
MQGPRPADEYNQQKSWFVNKIKQSETEAYSEAIVISPMMARIMLERNPSNRKIREAMVKQLSSDMENGRFRFNGEPIIFAKNGDLNDGQHRLSAIVASGVPQKMFVAFGLERGSRFTIDLGARRNAGDQLNLQGYGASGAIIAAVARMAIAYEKTEFKTLGRTNDVSTPEATERAQNDALLIECARWAYAQNKKMAKFAPMREIGFIYYTLAKIDPRKARTFMETFRDGLNLDEKSPLYVAREKLMAIKATPALRTEIFFRGWNLWLRDRAISKIQTNGMLPPLEGK